jgi:hypothetical protein
LHCHGGRSDVVNHAKIKKKWLLKTKLPIRAYATTEVRKISEMEKQLSLAAQETVTPLTAQLCNDKPTCSQTQCRAIITNVRAPFATKQILQELKEVRFM